MTEMKAIIFDCFGVLYVDYSKVYFAEFPDLREKLHKLDAACDYGLISRQDYLEGVSKITGDSLGIITEAFKREHTANKPLITYISKELKPHYKIGLLSNIGRGWIQDFFDEHDLHELFDAAVLSSEEGMTKPDAEIYRRAAERLGVTPGTCIMIDDRPENCRGAEAAGMQSVLYETYAQMKAELEHRLLK